MIAVDAMGGDFAPEAVLEGALRCVKATGIDVCLFGPKGELQRRLSQLDSSWRDYSLSIIDAAEVIGMGEEPVRAVKRKKESSLIKAVESVSKGACKAIISAGNSGAVMAASLLLIGRDKGIERPALVGLVPALKRPVVCLDLGANTDCKAEHLYQFAHLGVEYASKVKASLDTSPYAELRGTLGTNGFVQRPSVGLLSNGEEPTKGSLVTKQAFGMLEKSSLHFIGNVEPFHILQNKADVVVCDGFVGNVLLKTLEAVASFCCSIVRESDAKSFALLQDKLRLREQGGALLLGIKKTVMVMHGSASPQNIERAIRYADFSRD